MDKHCKPEKKKGRSGPLQLKKCDSFMPETVVTETPVIHLLRPLIQTRVLVVAENEQLHPIPL
ncbi:MAG: hypothetical protein U9N86_11930 [Bacteroidota bacterium]|nr:hypothetical protein [Bacteroidota bacterium]